MSFRPQKSMVLLVSIGISISIIAFSSIIRGYIFSLAEANMKYFILYAEKVRILLYASCLLSGIIIGFGAMCCGSTKDECKKISLISFLAGISLVTFTYIMIFTNAGENYMIPLYWSEYGSEASMLISGLLFVNAYKNYKIYLKK